MKNRRPLFAAAIALFLAAAAVAAPKPVTNPRQYADGRPAAAARLPATDSGVVLHHGGGPGDCDIRGAREAVVYADRGVYHLFYDGAGKTGWRACLATSRDLVHWEKHGPVLEMGAPGQPDSAAATSPWVIREGATWYMYYLGTPHVTPAPDYIPAFPYLTLLATAPKLAGPWTKHYDVTPFSPRPNSWCATTASPGFIIRYHDEYLQYMSGSCQPQPHVTKRTLGLARTRNLAGSWQLMKDPLLPLSEQVENSSLYYEAASGTWFVFTNHIGCDPLPDGRIHEYTDAIWVYWSKDPLRWNPQHKAVVLDGSNCTWSKRCIGMPAVIRAGNRLAVLYDAPGGDSTSHMQRDIGLAWLTLPLVAPAVK